MASETAAANDSATQTLLDEIRECVIEGEDERCAELTQKAADQGLEPSTILDQALVPAMKHIGDAWDRMEIFLPEAVMVANAMKAAMAIVIPMFQATAGGWEPRGTVVIGTVKGDLHDIGKTIVGNILAANGFQVHDLGTNVSPDRFIEAAEQNNADIIGLSALMTTTMPIQRDLVEFLAATDLRERYIVMVGGAPTTVEWVEKIDADGWGGDAYQACAKAIELVDAKKKAASA